MVLASCALPPRPVAPAPAVTSSHAVAPPQAGAPSHAIAASHAVTPPGFPGAYYRAAVARGDRVYEVDPSRSLVTVVVHRGGTLMRLGHDHVVAIRDLRGFIDPGAGRADLYAKLDAMTVDEPALRHDAHFDTQPSAADIAGTRHNMLLRVLRVDLHPFVEVALRDVADASNRHTLQASVTLNGVTRSVPVLLTRNALDPDFEATGTFAIDQTDFGLVPMSLFGGAITVEDRLELHVDLHADRIFASAEAATRKGQD